MRFVLIAIVLLAALPATAAAPSSWKSLDTAARTSCGREIVRLASKAKIRGVTGHVSGIGAGNDADRYYALLLDGKTAGFPSQWLCLYDKRARQATAQEIERR